MPHNRIAFYVPSLRGGGAERVMVTLANGFADAGYASDLVVANASGPYRCAVSNDVRVLDLRSSRVLTSLPALARYFWTERPIGVVSSMGHANVIALIARSLTIGRFPIAAREENTNSKDRIGLNPWKRLMMSTSRRIMYRWADCIVAVSEGVASDFLQLYPKFEDKVRVVYNPVVTPELLRLANEELHHPWFAEKRVPVVLGVGRLNQQKDFETLIKAFKQVIEREPARLMILGEGPDREKLEKLIEDHDLADKVLMPGFVENPFKFMRNCAVYVLSSRWEGLPSTLIEAIACGSEVVATDCESGPREILLGGRIGRLVPVGDEFELSRAICGALRDEPSDSAVIEATLLRFTPEVILNQYLEIFSLKNERKNLSQYS